MDARDDLTPARLQEDSQRPKPEGMCSDPDGYKRYLRDSEREFRDKIARQKIAQKKL